MDAAVPDALKLALFEQLLECTPALTWIKDEAQRLIYMNDAFVSTFGINKADWMHKSGWDLFPEPQARVMAEVESRVQTTGATEQSVDTVTFEGRTQHFLSWKYPLAQPDGRVYIGGFTIDITRQVEAEQALTLTVERQREEAQLRDRLIALVSHDVRSPLRNMVSLMDMALEPERPLPQTKAMDLMGQLQRKAVGTLNMVDEIIGWARMSLSVDQLANQPVSLIQVVRQALYTVGEQVKEKRISVEVNQLEGLYAGIHEGILVSVLRNVISNGVKFSSHEGTVQVTAEEAGQQVRIHVTDQGVGVSTQASELLAAGEFQMPAEGTSGEVGQGMALALCRDLLRKHGGNLEAARLAEGGSRFTITVAAPPGGAKQRRLVYVSEARPALKPEELSAILRVARARNEAAGICGVLVYSGTRFLQLMHGSPEAIDRTMSRISADERHGRVEVLLDEVADRPMFPTWGMRFAAISDLLVAQIRAGDLQALEQALQGGLLPSQGAP